MSDIKVWEGNGCRPEGDVVMGCRWLEAHFHTLYNRHLDETIHQEQLTYFFIIQMIINFIILYALYI